MILIRVRVNTKTGRSKAQYTVEPLDQPSWNTIGQAVSELDLGLMLGRWLETEHKSECGGMMPYRIMVEEVTITLRETEIT